MSMQNPSVVQDSVDSLIDGVNTQAFAEDQIEDTGQHAHTSNFCCHGRAPTFRGVEIFYWFDPFDHNITFVPAIAFKASIPEASYRLPCCGILSSVDDYFPSSLRANVGPVVCFLVVFPVDMVYEAVNIRDRLGDSPLPP